ncbi:unnamed protein product [Cyprideis torosa]|uniref:Histone acetyltransferase n=1 Tax=Cyprideis torosa TaxID=163714 RepID=A0A7R8WIU1_9CRUS|nr:unnamed protein product [Cyprideis torosa]CAG0901086.1 unnamed protein product [Cyprideis torosa]
MPISSSSCLSPPAEVTAPEAPKRPRFSVNERVIVKRRRDESLRPACIVHVLKGSREYLVHYEDTDRRLDEFVSEDRVMAAEDQVRAPSTEAAVSTEGTARRLRRRGEGVETPKKTPLKEEQALEEEYDNLTKVKYIEKVALGNWVMDAWYYSPYPDQFGKTRTLYICEYCLKYMCNERSHRYHMSQCSIKKPRGREIYCHGAISVFEVDGKEDKLYCQCLCLLGKLFLKHKAVSYDVSEFLFYVATFYDGSACHIVGYFSKEKMSEEDYNVNCIMTLPPYQGHGFGKFLISFSYELSLLEGKVGGPERPLSDLAVVAYQSYWTYAVLQALLATDPCGDMTVEELSRRTAMTTEDICTTLTTLSRLQSPFFKLTFDWKARPKAVVLELLVGSPQKILSEFVPKLLPNPDAILWRPESQSG